MVFFMLSALLLIPLILCPFFVLNQYLCAENAVAFWDFAMYHEMAYHFWALPTLTEQVTLFIKSLSYNYNLFYALPTLFSFSLFSPSRLTFILTNYVVFTTSFLCGVGFLLRKIYVWSWIRSLIISFILALGLPFLWVPLIEGYPDHGASAFLAFAAGIALIKERSWKHFLSVGMLLAAAIIFRRHFAFPALALLLMMGLFDLPSFIKKPWDYKRTALLNYLICGVSLLGTLFVIEPTYLKSMLTTNYVELYGSYKRPALYFIHYVFSQMGAGLLVCVLGGYGIASIKRPLLRLHLLKISTLLLFWILIWAFGPAQPGHHYLISILPLFCFIGLAGYFSSPLSSSKKNLTLLTVTIFLLFNSLYSFWLAPKFIYPSEKPHFALLSTPRIAWKRTDKDSYIQLGRYLRDETSTNDKIIAVGSSFVFNQNLIARFLPDQKTAQKLLPTSEIDSQQPPPLQAYQYGTVFLIAIPTQYHLDPAKQSVITSLAQMFPPPKALDSYFKKEPIEYTLEDNITLTVWRRVKPWQKEDLILGIKTILKSIKDIAKSQEGA